MRRILVVVYVLALAGTAEPAAVEVRSLTSRVARDAPVTFGQAFRKGDVPAGQQIHCMVGDGWAQADVKRRYDDDSVRFAVISAILPTLDGPTTLTLSAGPPRPGKPLLPVTLDALLETAFDASVKMTFPDGTVRSVSARPLLAKGKPTAWLQGHVASEWLVDGAIDEDLHVRFQIRAYAGMRRVRVSVAVENCWDTWAGNIRYDVALSVGGKEVFGRKAVDHRRLSRWRKMFWWGEDGPAVHVAHDLAYLSSTGALPNYDVAVQPSEPGWETRRGLQMAGPDWDILGRGALTAYMPTTGGRPEIAPYPAWTVRYLLNMKPREKQFVLASGDLAGSWPIHVRARSTRRALTIDGRPEFWLDRRGKDRPTWKPARPEPAPKRVRLAPDLAHQGSFAYVPYLVTGDYYYLEEAYFWAGYCLLATWPHPRQGAKGILSGQIRGNAWALRNLADAAWIAPDRAPEEAYFDAKVRNNIADRTRRMLGPPEHSALGFWGERTTQDARIQKPANPDWMIMAPWEHDYLMWSLHHLVELGYPEAAKPRDYLLRWRVGSLTNAPDFDPMLAAPYRLVVGERKPDKSTLFYTDWKALGRENARLSRPGLPTGGNGYAYSARAALVCGVDGGFPKAREALAWLDANLADRRKVLARNPSWAIIPGGAAARQQGRAAEEE